MNPDTDDKGGLATLEPKAAPVRPPAHDDWGDEDVKATGFKKWRAPLTVALITVVGIFYAVKAFSKAGSGGGRKESTTMVQIQLPPAPPPPPPPPPPPETMKEEEMIKQEEDKEEPDPTPAIDTAVKGPASGGLQIAQQKGRGFFDKRPDNGKTKWGWYAAQVQTSISDALRKNPRTRKANVRIEVRIWLDPATGRSTRAKLVGSTGDPALDAAIGEVLTGLQFQQPPPEGMPMPIVIRVTAKPQR